MNTQTLPAVDAPQIEFPTYDRVGSGWMLVAGAFLLLLLF